uniref:Uncharacterized protein LOC116297910 n=1 Tax=Actinia tenebrosa TaxID=6105 RepID=A0A6P8I3Q6_ACTTE
MAKQVSPYGSWVSPISSDLVIKESLSLREVRLDPLDKGTVYWSELHPEEAGRTIICKVKDDDKNIEVLTPQDFNCRTLVHEMGGGTFIVYNKKIYFSNFGDQRLYSQESKPGCTPVPITPEGKQWRYADADVALNGRVLVCVREDHDVLKEGAEEALNTIVSIDLETQKQNVLVSGCNFYASPRVSHSGMLAWFQWNHPNMPWDDTELWVGQLNEAGDGFVEGTKKKVSGGVGISISSPRWSNDGKLLFISDKNNWWNLYKLEDDGTETNLCPLEKELGIPHWIFGMNAYACDPRPGNKDVLVTFGENLSLLKPNGELLNIETGGTQHSQVVTDGHSAYLITRSATRFPALIRVNLESKKVTVLKESFTVHVDPEYLSVPREVTYPTTDDKVSHGFFYPPKNKDFNAPEGSLPPLLVKVHGGPTSACGPALNLEIQFFTSRGIAVLDVNYRGSTTYGRKYREELKGNWGIVDMDDCCNGALYLANTTKEVDVNKLAIDGGSAGGYTTLSVLTFRDVFKAGASFYGISDVEALAKDTHKFESRYIDTLIGPYPEAKDVYKERSPIHYVEKLNCPIALFQGDEDKIVPPNQAEMMFNAVKNKGLPVAYKLYKGEQHGFRKAENIKSTLEGELYFFSKVFGFSAPGLTVELEIHNLK